MSDDRPPAAPPATAPRRFRAAWGAAGALVLLGVAAAVAAWHWPRRPTLPIDERRSPAATGEDQDPRLAYTGPYRNVRPEVRYVGDAACADCHAEQEQTYRRHPMGHSLVPVAPLAAARERYPRTAEQLLGPLGVPTVRAAEQAYRRAVHNPFAKFGSVFSVQERDGHVYHREERRDGRGRVVAAIEQEAAYQIGSGAHGHSYLVARGGCLFQSPISWFSQKQRWDISPTFRQTMHYERAIREECLFCHSNYADHVAQTVARYREPIFRGHAIGCERCHGPGQLHVEARGRGDGGAGADVTIVNPARLEPVLREAVCQQCHLLGERRILRRGRNTFDYRPGLPLDLFYAVFVNRRDLPEPDQAVSHVEQMVVSRCFTASKGKLGCTSCHDPHVLPAPETRVEYYRQRCLKCHEEGGNGCTLSLESRRRKNADDCAACHMPRTPAPDVAHTAVTDHRVLRRPAGGAAEPADPRPPGAPGELPFVPFYRGPGGATDRDARRDLALAIIGEARHSPPNAVQAAEMALPLLDEAGRAWPQDAPAWEARGYAFKVLGRQAEARSSWQRVLDLVPAREETLTDLALLDEALDRPEEALGYWRRALALNPTDTDYRGHEARLLAQLGDWPAATTSARQALGDNPFNSEPRRLLIRAYLRAGKKDEARAELDTLVALEPEKEEELRSWFVEQAGK